MGTEAFWVPALLSAASAGTQYVNQSQANARQQNAEVNAIGNQENLQGKANAQVKQLTQQIGQNSPSELADQATGKYIQALRQNAAGSTQGGSTTSSPINFGQSTSALPPSTVGSSRYKSGIAGSQQEVQDYGNQLAGEMGQIDAATRQRQNEGLGMQSLGTGLNLLGAQSYTQNFANQLRASAAGQQSPWLSLLSNTLGGAANTLSQNMGGEPLNSGGSINPYYAPQQGLVQTPQMGGN